MIASLAGHRKEQFSRHREDLGEILRAVRIEQGRFAAIHRVTEFGVSRIQFELCHRIAARACLLEEVGEFVDDDVVTVITRFGVLYITPGEHDAIAVDRKTGERAPALGHHPGVLVFEGLLDHELIGVQCDAVQRPIPIVRLAQGHKTGLRGDARAHRIVDL